jgi:hypothetical protein
MLGAQKNPLRGGLERRRKNFQQGLKGQKPLTMIWTLAPLFS